MRVRAEPSSGASWTGTSLVVSLALAAAAAAAAVAVRAGLGGPAVAAAVSFLAASWLGWRAKRAPGPHGSLAVAAGLGFALAVAGVFSSATTSVGLEAVAGAAALSAVLDAAAWRARARRGTESGSARLVRSRGREVAVPEAELGPGDRVRVAAGTTVPADGVLAPGAPVRFDGQAIGLARPIEVAGGGPVFQGWVPEVEVEVEVARAPRDSLLRLRDEAIDRVGAKHRGGGRVAAAAGVSIGIAAALRWGLGLAPDPAVWATEAAGLLLSLPVGLFLVEAQRRRRSALEVLTGAGVIVRRPPDLEELLKAARWQLDPALLVGPGTVEMVVFDETPKAHALGVAAALVSETDDPHAEAIRRAARERGTDGFRGAAFSHRGGVWMGTVQGARWHLGSRAALERVSRLKLPRSLEGTVSFLEDQGRRVLLLSTPEGGPVAALGVDVEPLPEAWAVARALFASVPPGADEALRTAVLRKSGLEAAAELGGKKTVVLCHPDGPEPARGLAVRVLPLLIGLELNEGPPRIWEPALPGFPEALAGARRSMAERRPVWPALLTPPLAALAGAAGGLGPAVGAGFGAVACAWVLAGRRAKAVEEVDVTLSGVEAVSATPSPGRKSGPGDAGRDRAPPGSATPRAPLDPDETILDPG